MKTMKADHDLSLTWYVFLLADVFEKFKNKCKEDYGLDPSHTFLKKLAKLTVKV